ncbi:MAG: nickel transporter permease NikB [Methanosaeta sp. PtaB.Bin005]|nr:MAG: nickel transporter permease NikB [Methanosaeta sp. PtaB.Bin005]OPY55934.1 MAG: nickel transporter permease NikB [Methanosaeta sp. PtaU1.Bin112]
MLKFLAKRILLLVPVLLLVSIISFSLFYLSPGDPAEILLTGPQGPPDPAAVEEFRQRAGFNDPAPAMYLRWLSKVIEGDLGYSYVSGGKVSNAVLDSFRPTMRLALISLVISLLISFPLGILSAVRQGSFVDGLGMAVSLLGVSIPNFWLAYLLIILFSLRLDILPVAGYGMGGDIEHLILPAVTLGISAAAVTSRMIRTSMLESLEQDYIVAARARGLSERSVVLRHALRNALLPVITVVSLNFTYLLNGSAVVETVFAWPGIGNLMTRSIYSRDYPVILGCMLFLASIILVMNLLTDICYHYLNPRMAHEVQD